MPFDVVALTQELVRIPSVNPMGRGVKESPFLETRLTEFLISEMHQLGLPCERHTVFPGRDNLLTRLDGRGRSREMTLLLEAHQDTVPVDGMTIPPFDGALHDERIWGRGACDVKGGLATILATLSRLAERPSDDQPTIVVAMTVNEENGFDGIKHLSRTWQSGQSRLLPQAPDYAVVMEPSELDVIVAHKGCVRWRAHTVGRAAHSSDPRKGNNAIYRMADLISALEDYAQHGLPERTDAWLGAPTLSVGTIIGGVSVNTVPDRCTLEIDRRLLPEEDPDEAWQHVVNQLQQRGIPAEVVHDTPFLFGYGLSSEQNDSLATSLIDACRRHDVRSRRRGVPFGTNAGVVSAAGVPAVVFGPGSITQAHTRDEWIDVRHLPVAVDILEDFCRNTDLLTRIRSD